MASKHNPWHIPHLTLDESWKEGGLCRGRDYLFFSLDEKVQAEAKLICRKCPVISDCLDYVTKLPGDTQGIWAGMTAKERRNERRRRMRKGVIK